VRWAALKAVEFDPLEALKKPVAGQGPSPGWQVNEEVARELCRDCLVALANGLGVEDADYAEFKEYMSSASTQRCVCVCVVCRT
jgi:hypothetical protein